MRHEQIRYAESQVEHYKRRMPRENRRILYRRHRSRRVVADHLAGDRKPAGDGQQVLNMAIEGLSNQEIADILGISINTVHPQVPRLQSPAHQISNQWML